MGGVWGSVLVAVRELLGAIFGPFGAVLYAVSVSVREVVGATVGFLGVVLVYGKAWVLFGVLLWFW